MAVTLQQIAEKAGVSQATVSIALGSAGRVSDKTRKRVLAIANELGYRPNLLVHAIQTGRTNSIGVLMQLEDNYCSQVFAGIQHALGEAKCVPIVLSPVDGATEVEQMHALIDRRVDGILIRPSGSAQWEQHLDEALERHVPVVAVDIEPHADTPHVDFVGSDDVRGANIAVEKLLQTGHKHLGVVSTGQYPDRMVFRQKTFEAEVAKHKDASCVCINQPWSKNIVGYEAAIKLLQMTPRPTGIFCTMDRLAVGVYRAALEMGLSIPDDLSVIGFSDEPVARYLHPRLTTIQQTPYETGLQATELLLEQIEAGRSKKTSRSRILIDCTLVERKSAATAP